MKILSNTKFQGMVDKIKELEEEKEKIQKKYNNKDFKYLEKYNTYRDKADKLEETNKYHQELIKIKENDVAQISKKYKEAISKNTEYASKINELIKQIDETTKKFDKYRKEKEIEISDLKSDRYLKIECEPDKPGKTQKMKLYSKQRTSEIIKNVKEKL